MAEVARNVLRSTMMKVLPQIIQVAMRGFSEGIRNRSVPRPNPDQIHNSRELIRAGPLVVRPAVRQVARGLGEPASSDSSVCAYWEAGRRLSFLQPRPATGGVPQLTHRVEPLLWDPALNLGQLLFSETFGRSGS